MKNLKQGFVIFSFTFISSFLFSTSVDSKVLKSKVIAKKKTFKLLSHSEFKVLPEKLRTKYIEALQDFAISFDNGFRTTEVKSFREELFALLIDKAYAKKDLEYKICSYAGWFSKADNNPPLPPGANCTSVFIPAMNCPGNSKMIQCRPALFGRELDGSPYCVPKNRNASKNCKAKSTSKTVAENIFKGTYNDLQLPGLIGRDKIKNEPLLDGINEEFSKHCQTMINVQTGNSYTSYSSDQKDYIDDQVGTCNTVGTQIRDIKVTYGRSLQTFFNRNKLDGARKAFIDKYDLDSDGREDLEETLKKHVSDLIERYPGSSISYVDNEIRVNADINTSLTNLRAAYEAFNPEFYYKVGEDFKVKMEDREREKRRLAYLKKIKELGCEGGDSHVPSFDMAKGFENPLDDNSFKGNLLCKTAIDDLGPYNGFNYLSIRAEPNSSNSPLYVYYTKDKSKGWCIKKIHRKNLNFERKHKNNISHCNNEVTIKDESLGWLNNIRFKRNNESNQCIVKKVNPGLGKNKKLPNEQRNYSDGNTDILHSNIPALKHLNPRDRDKILNYNPKEQSIDSLSCVDSESLQFYEALNLMRKHYSGCKELQFSASYGSQGTSESGKYGRTNPRRVKGENPSVVIPKNANVVNQTINLKIHGAKGSEYVQNLGRLSNSLTGKIKTTAGWVDAINKSWKKKTGQTLKNWCSNSGDNLVPKPSRRGRNN